MVIVGGAYENLKPYITSVQESSELKEYKDDIEACLAEMESQSDNEVVGLEYSCAINVAATFYESDPEKAIKLCMSKNPFFDVQSGSDDIYAQRNEQLARSSCKASIEGRVDM